MHIAHPCGAIRTQVAAGTAPFAQDLGLVMPHLVLRERENVEAGGTESRKPLLVGGGVERCKVVAIALDLNDERHVGAPAVDATDPSHLIAEVDLGLGQWLAVPFEDVEEPKLEI